MRHRFHSICPYFAMFPESFVAKHLAATKFNGVVFDPFCGRGTTIFESLIQERDAAGCDIHPVAVCVSGAKSDPPTRQEVLERLFRLEEDSVSFRDIEPEGELSEFFGLCFDSDTYTQVQFLRQSLSWRHDRTDRFIAALCLGALHGESHRSPNYFSNRMPRTISTKPGYSVRWWKKNGYRPPYRDTFRILRHMTDYRFRTPPPRARGTVAMSDARRAASTFPELLETVSDVITSPPYLDTTNYHEDQWLRLWFLGSDAIVNHAGGDGRHYNAVKYWTFLTEAWTGLAPLLAQESRVVVRIGSGKLAKAEIRKALTDSLELGTKRSVELIGVELSSMAVSTQANAFRGSKPSPKLEHDFCFLLT